jgi:hypothetical protein
MAFHPIDDQQSERQALTLFPSMSDMNAEPAFMDMLIATSAATEDSN